MPNNLSFSHSYPKENISGQFLHYKNEIMPLNMSTEVCETDILEMQTRKLTVLSTISILTLVSNGAIMVAILTRNKKVLRRLKLSYQSIAPICDNTLYSFCSEAFYHLNMSFNMSFKSIKHLISLIFRVFLHHLLFMPHGLKRIF